jgi:hypothetical protein
VPGNWKRLKVERQKLKETEKRKTYTEITEDAEFTEKRTQKLHEI